MALVKVTVEGHGTYTADSRTLGNFLERHYGDVNANAYTLRKYAESVCGFNEGSNAYVDDDDMVTAMAIIDSGNYSLQHYSNYCAFGA